MALQHYRGKPATDTITIRGFGASKETLLAQLQSHRVANRSHSCWKRQELMRWAEVQILAVPSQLAVAIRWLSGLNAT